MRPRRGWCEAVTCQLRPSLQPGALLPHLQYIICNLALQAQWAVENWPAWPDTPAGSVPLEACLYTLHQGGGRRVLKAGIKGVLRMQCEWGVTNGRTEHNTVLKHPVQPRQAWNLAELEH